MYKEKSMEIGAQNGNLVQSAASPISKGQASPQSSKAELSNEPGMLADVHHKNPVIDPTPTYVRPVSISSNDEVVKKTVDEALDDIALATVHLFTPGGDLSQSVERMTKQYDSIMSELNKQQPQLTNKDWGISITGSGELQVTGALTEDEQTLVEQT
jgi:hypothetical protein